MKPFATIFACLVWAVWQPAPTAAAPPNGLTVSAEFPSIHDGDTLTAIVSFRVNVRLCGHEKGKQCWAKELKEPGGPESRDNLKAVAEGKHGTLWIPLSSTNNLSSAFTMGRILADGWIDGMDESLSEYQVRSGHASTRKYGKLGE